MAEAPRDEDLGATSTMLNRGIKRSPSGSDTSGTGFDSEASEDASEDFIVREAKRPCSSTLRPLAVAAEAESANECLSLRGSIVPGRATCVACPASSVLISGLCLSCYKSRLCSLNYRDERDRVRVYDMDGKHISPIDLLTLPGHLPVNTVLSMEVWGIVLNDEAQPHWLLADDGTEVRVRAPRCVCFVNPALVAGEYDPLGLHGTVVSGMATVPSEPPCHDIPLVPDEDIVTPPSPTFSMVTISPPIF